MCGILGVVNSEDKISNIRLAILNDTMENRGPDGSGIFCEKQTGIAMRRLAIIDVEGGQQPIFSENKNVAVVMNGEIYNYRELRKQLIGAGHQFTSHSDTETLVHGYEEFGIDGLLDRVDGMFTFALWDRLLGRMFLARDRLGEKPLYIARENNTVIFGSQLLTVVAALRETPPICPAALQLYWALHFVPGDRTIFRDVRRLRAGEACEINTVNGEELRSWRYWQLRENQRSTNSSELTERILGAVKSRLVADVPVGVFLSGGLDSSLLAAMAARYVTGIHTFSIGFDSSRHDESAFAWEVADYIGANHHHFMFRANDFRDVIPNVVAAMDEPVGDQAMLPLYVLAREASKVVKVALSGEGADEIFGGYAYYSRFVNGPQGGRVQRLGHLISGSRLNNARFIGADEETASGFPTVLPRWIRRRLSEGSWDSQDEWHQDLLGDLASVKDPLRRATLCDVETWLSEDLLMKADKMTMANSLESRAPYLSPALAEAGFNLPLRQKLLNGTAKTALRAVAQDHLPRAIFRRPKQGWVLPMGRWLRNDLKDQFIDSIKACNESLIDRKFTEEIVVQDSLDGFVGERALYAILVMVQWLNYAREKTDQIRRSVTSGKSAVN
jgi:asparagine synthase (glutamine-hydrolysing)